MKPQLLSLLFVLACLAITLALPSCTPNNTGNAGDGTYSAPATLSPVEATDQMRSKFRNIR